MTTEYCAYPDCQAYREKDLDKKTFISGIPWFCGGHENSFIRCSHSGCTQIIVLSEGQQPDHFWHCHEHEGEPLPTSHGADLEAAMARGPHPLKPGEHPKTTLKCAYQGCTAGRDFDVADQIPAHWYCPKHGPHYLPREAPIQTADQNKYNAQVDKAYMDLVLLMAFNKCSEEKMRDILIRISSNCYAMGYHEGLKHKDKRPGWGN